MVNLVSDVPGVLAGITSALGERAVNIANCHLGRRYVGEGSPENCGLAIFHIDGECPDEVTQQVQRIPAIRVCKMLKV